MTVVIRGYIYERNSNMHILELAEQSAVQIKITAPILEQSEEIWHSSNIKYKDSLHLACAEAAKVDVLLTTDRKFMNNCSRIKPYTKVLGPNQ